MLAFCRNYFAFVAKERSKYICHAFMEYKVSTYHIIEELSVRFMFLLTLQIDAGTIVTTVQNTLVPQSAK